MGKNLKKDIVILFLIIILLSITHSYAIVKENEGVKDKLFFEISKLEVTKNEKIEMILNLDKIEYSKFIFELQTDDNIENMEIYNNDNFEIVKNNNEIVMEIDKSKTNINTINLYYNIPDDKKVGDIMKFIATITNIENEENDNIGNNEIDHEENQVKKESIKTDVKIIEESNIKDETKEEKNQNIEEKKSEVNIIQNDNKKNIHQETYSSNSLNNNKAIQITYNGSDNNYLCKLSVKGFELNKNFTKENTTYFVSVENDVEELSIYAKADDSRSKVCIYGNDRLKVGLNKILISVTAENGIVKNYRIYVTKNV